MLYLTIIAIVIVVFLQLRFFWENRRDIHKLGRIFSTPQRWEIFLRDESMEEEEGTSYYLIRSDRGGLTNEYSEITQSINEYLMSSAASVVDANSIRDIVDRKCDSIENEIQALLPFPLYCGLVGTMIGVVLGLAGLLFSGEISSLLDGNADTAIMLGDGISTLLWGVVFAMIASAIGISLTTANSKAYKKNKKALDLGKANFLAWLHEELMPNLPSSMSSVFSHLTKNLNDFNDTFKENTVGLAEMLQAVNHSYTNQTSILEAVKNLDVVQMSKANVEVWKELQESTYKIEQFNNYLNAIQGYTDRIHAFEVLFDKETERLQILEEIRDFFYNYKGSIAKTSADADNTIQEALNSVKDNITEAIKKLQEAFERQTQYVQNAAQSQADTFSETSKNMHSAFLSEMERLPTLSRQLDDIASIPNALTSVANRIEDSNKQLAEDIARSFQKAIASLEQKQRSVSSASQIFYNQPKQEWGQSSHNTTLSKSNVQPMIPTNSVTSKKTSRIRRFFGAIFGPKKAQ
nr:hypothetical protein [uncultured Porphyromonas sp.]